METQKTSTVIKRLLTIKEAAEYLNIAVGTLYNLASRKKIDVVKPFKGSRCIRFDRYYLEKMIEDNTVKAYDSGKFNWDR